MALPTEYTEDWGFNALGPEQGISIVEPYETLPDSPLHLLALAPAAGLFAVGGASTVAVGELASLRAALEAEEPAQLLKSLVHDSPVHLAFSSSEKQLFVYSLDKTISAYNTQDWRCEFTSAPLEAPVTKLQAFRSKQGLVLATPNGIVVVDEHGNLSTTAPDPIFTLGPADEIITPSQVELNSIGKAGKVLGFHTLAPGYLFLIAENAKEPEEYLTYMRNEGNEWLEVENSLIAPDTGRPFMWHQAALQSWPSSSLAFTSVAVSSYSSELMLLSPGEVWKPMNETDNLPFTTNDEDVIAVGGVLDLTDATPRESLTGIEGKNPFPLWLVLTQEGRILGWHVVCREASRDGVKCAIPPKTDLPNLPAINVAAVENDIAAEELDEISESDARDSAQAPDTKKSPDTLSPASDESKYTARSFEDHATENVASEAPSTENKSDGASSGEALERSKPAKSESTANPATGVPKATFGSTWGSTPGFAAWASAGSNQSPFSQVAPLASTPNVSPFGGSGDAVSSAFGSRAPQSASPFKGLGSQSQPASTTPATSNSSIFGSNPNKDHFAAFRNTGSPFTQPKTVNQDPAKIVEQSESKNNTRRDVSDSGEASGAPSSSGLLATTDRAAGSEDKPDLLSATSEPDLAAKDEKQATDESRASAKDGQYVGANADAPAKEEPKERPEVGTGEETKRNMQAETEGERNAIAARKAEADRTAEAKRKIEMERIADAERKAEAERQANAKDKAESERKARADAASKAEADRKARDLAARIDSTIWLGSRDTTLHSLTSVLKEVPLNDVSDMDAIYAQTNLLFQILDHNLSVLEQSDIYKEAASQHRAFSDFNQWNIGDVPTLEQDIQALLAGRAHEISKSTDTTLRNASDMSREAGGALADLSSLEATLAEVNAETGDLAYQLRPLPARSAHYRRELHSKLGKISRLMREAKEAVLLTRTQLGETVEYSSILAAAESIDSRLYALGSCLKDVGDGIPRRIGAIASHPTSRFASNQGVSRLNSGEALGAVPISANNVPAAITTIMGPEHPALLREQLNSTEALLNSLKQRNADSCITSVDL